MTPRNDIECGLDSNRLPPWGNWDNAMIRGGGGRYAQHVGRVLRHGTLVPVFIIDDIDRENWFYQWVKPR